MLLNELSDQDLRVLEGKALECELLIRQRFKFFQKKLKELSDAICESFFGEEDGCFYASLKGELALPWWYKRYSKETFLESQKGIELFTIEILNSTLGLKLEDQGFILDSKKELKPEITLKIKQLAQVLTLFRIVLGLTFIYSRFLNHPFILMDDYSSQPKDSDSLVTKCEDELKSEGEKQDIVERVYSNVLSSQANIKQLALRMSHDLKHFDPFMQHAVSALGHIFAKAKAVILNAYYEHTDNKWRELILKFTESLFPGHHWFSLYFMGSLTVSDNYYPLLANEVMDYSLSKQGAVYVSKLRFLKDAEAPLIQFLETIRIKAKDFGVQLESNTQKQLIPDGNKITPIAFFFSTPPESVPESSDAKVESDLSPLQLQ